MNWTSLHGRWQVLQDRPHPSPLVPRSNSLTTACFQLPSVGEDMSGLQTCLSWTVYQLKWTFRCWHQLLANGWTIPKKHGWTMVFTARCYAERGYMLRQFRPSVRPSVTRVHCIKTAECIIEILSLSDWPIILVPSFQLGTVSLAVCPSRDCLSCPRYK